MTEEMQDIEEMLNTLEVEVKGLPAECEEDEDKSKIADTDEEESDEDENEKLKKCKKSVKDEKISSTLTRFMNIFPQEEEGGKKKEIGKMIEFTYPAPSQFVEKSKEESKNHQNRAEYTPAFSGVPITTPKQSPTPKRPK